MGSGGSGCGGSGLWWQQVVVSGSNVHVVLKEEVLVNLQMKKNEKKKIPSWSLLRLCLHCGGLRLCRRCKWWQVVVAVHSISVNNHTITNHHYNNK